MKTTNYKIINSDRLKGIESSVLKLLNEGWQPHGVIGRTEDGLFYQAMILPEALTPMADLIDRAIFEALQDRVNINYSDILSIEGRLEKLEGK